MSENIVWVPHQVPLRRAATEQLILTVSCSVLSLNFYHNKAWIKAILKVVVSDVHQSE